MLFSSSVFIFIFMPVFFTLFFILKNRYYRISLILIFSLLFYGYGEPKFVFLMIFSILINYLFALIIAKYLNFKKVALFLGVIFNIIVLGYFKYAVFLVDIIDYFVDKNIAIKDILMPIGISFYTFQIISYLIDVYRNDVKVQKNPLILGSYITFFPQLIAGPIVRYKEVENDFKELRSSKNNLNKGIKRFIIGLGKKMILANNIALASDFVFYEIPKDDLNSLFIVFGIIAFALQIYFDFSGYSDMAIGLGLIMGFHFPENFNYPYISRSVADFWRRWHMTLGRFFKDYVYIPLGGNRVTFLKWIRNILIVWGLTGFWHGASTNFILWGLYFGIFLILETVFLNKFLEKSAIISRIYTLGVLLNGWLIFKVTDLNELIFLFKRLYGFTNASNKHSMSYFSLDQYIPLMLVAIILSTPVISIIIKRYNIPYIIKEFSYIVVLCISLLYVIGTKYNPFLYFRF